MSSGLSSGVSGLALGTGLYRDVSGLWGGASGFVTGDGASLSLNFLTMTAYTLDPRITFSRGSQAMVTDATGKLTYAPNNLLTNSESFEAAAWAKGANVTLSANSAIAPDGTTTADKFSTSSSGDASLNRISQTPTTASGNFIFSIWLRSDTNQTVRIKVTGTTGTVVVSTLDANVTSTWTRFDLKGENVTANAGVTIGPTGAASLTNIEIWGAQLEAVTYQTTPSPYVSTTPKNLLGYTQEFDNAAWTKNNVTITANTTAAPDGTATADTITATATNAIHNTTQAGGSSGVQQTFSVYVKAGTSSFIQLWHGAAASIFANFNLATGAIGTVGALATATIASVGNGWYRCAITCTPGSTNQFRVAMVTSATAVYGESWTAAGTETLFIWGAQLSNSASVDPYVYNPVAAPTSAAYYGPRFDYDPVTLANKGLLIEEQRTNLLLQSENFTTSWGAVSTTVTANTTVAPDGTTTADTLTAATTGAYVQQNVTFTGDGDKAYSVFVKAGTSTTTRLTLRDTTAAANRGSVDITWTAGVASGVASVGTLQGIDSFGNGWYRVRMLATGVVAANANQFRFGPDPIAGTGTSIMWGAQAENGAFATSYIPTVASTVTRSADVALMQGANFSQWYNQSEGTLVSAFSSFTPTGVSQAAWTISDGTNNERWFVFCPSTAIRHFMVDGGVTQASIDVGTYAANSVFKSAMAIRLNSVQAAVNGVLGTEDTNATIPTVDRLGFGTAPSAATNFLNGHMRTIAYYSTRLPNLQLQALTQ